MKKLLYSSIVLLLFSTSILLFQISCQKDAEANPQEEVSSSNQQLNKLVFKKLSWPSQKIVSEIWIVNYDGSNPTNVGTYCCFYTDKKGKYQELDKVPEEVLILA